MNKGTLQVLQVNQGVTLRTPFFERFWHLLRPCVAQSHFSVSTAHENTLCGTSATVFSELSRTEGADRSDQLLP